MDGGISATRGRFTTLAEHAASAARAAQDAQEEAASEGQGLDDEPGSATFRGSASRNVFSSHVNSESNVRWRRLPAALPAVRCPARHAGTGQCGVARWSDQSSAPGARSADTQGRLRSLRGTLGPVQAPRAPQVTG